MKKIDSAGDLEEKLVLRTRHAMTNDKK